MEMTFSKLPFEGKKHTLFQSITLHLLPGLLIAVAYFCLVNIVDKMGLPNLAALIFAAIIVLIPFELGVLFFLKKKYQLNSIFDLLEYREKQSFLQTLLWVVVVFVACGIIFTAMKSVSQYFENLFSFIPMEYHLNMGSVDEYSKFSLIITYILGIVVVVVVAPVVEELYFRGYLLPRIPAGKWGTPFVHSLLFALYHFWTPWMFVTRSIGLLPLVLVVQKTRNIRIGMIAHVLINSIDFISAFALLAVVVS